MILSRPDPDSVVERQLQSLFRHKDRKGTLRESRTKIWGRVWLIESISLSSSWTTLVGPSREDHPFTYDSFTSLQVGSLHFLIIAASQWVWSHYGFGLWWWTRQFHFQMTSQLACCHRLWISLLKFLSEDLFGSGCMWVREGMGGQGQVSVRRSHGQP